MSFVPRRPERASLRHLGTSTRTVPDDEATVTVRPGQTLWSIAADYAGPMATDWEVAAEWPRWYRANRHTIGPEPGALRAGTLLRRPGPAVTAATSSETEAGVWS
ncbi:LysM domain-containing protein [Nesterenkonia sp.]|uniref:LysM peptidoglycan-binding domain-containing protein n=1 Tax=Nesterenkonia sp. TaxID=704201 RepID=UPI0026168014|nr:LysM domain-containing protein [Nesterenkonia sp.]